MTHMTDKLIHFEQGEMENRYSPSKDVQDELSALHRTMTMETTWLNLYNEVYCPPGQSILHMALAAASIMAIPGCNGLYVSMVAFRFWPQLYMDLKSVDLQIYTNVDLQFWHWYLEVRYHRREAYVHANVFLSPSFHNSSSSDTNSAYLTIHMQLHTTAVISNTTLTRTSRIYNIIRKTIFNVQTEVTLFKMLFFTHCINTENTKWSNQNKVTILP